MASTCTKKLLPHEDAHSNIEFSWVNMALISCENVISIKHKADIDWLLESPKRRKSVAKRVNSDPKKRKGRPSVADVFPSVVDTARVFVESNGFKAHRGRAQDIGTCGTTIPAIKEHLFHTVPGLKENRPNLG